jgi:general secretion pathway protein E
MLGYTTSIPQVQQAVLTTLKLDFSIIKFSDAKRLRIACAQLSRRPGQLTLLMVDPISQTTRQWAAYHHPEASANIVQISDIQLNRLFIEWELKQSAIEAIGEGEGTSPLDQFDLTELSLANIDAESNSVVKFVSATLVDALRKGCSDIHYEATPTELVVRYRVDGVLVQAAKVSGREESDRVVSRIKVLSNLDISEKRVPQDGRLEVAYESRKIDIRVSVMPSIHGEDIVLRILDRGGLGELKPALRLADLGLPSALVDGLIALCKKSHGMVLVTGPTGSGKTTTLYAALTSTYDPGEKVVTIEDPVEYQLSGVLQVPVNEKKGLTFARGLRSILRHDPDRILVGEIRDQETAKIAVQAALTGHNVYSTVHANDAIDVLARFRQLGVEDFEISSALNGIVAQRLVRMLCTFCAEPSSEIPVEIQRHSLKSETSAVMKRPLGCPRCAHSGFSGRQLIAELVMITPEFRAKFVGGGSMLELTELSQTQGTNKLRIQALNLVSRGQTTMEEINRVTQPE